MYIPTRHVVASIAGTRYTKLDFSGELGAHKLAKELDAWWLVRGHPQVKHHVITVGSFGKNHGSGRTIYGVRSNLVNGLPPKVDRYNGQQ